jgi:hypothetical protein
MNDPLLQDPWQHTCGESKEDWMCGKTEPVRLDVWKNRTSHTVYSMQGDETWYTWALHYLIPKQQKPLLGNTFLKLSSFFMTQTSRFLIFNCPYSVPSHKCPKFCASVTSAPYMLQLRTKYIPLPSARKGHSNEVFFVLLEQKPLS